VNYEAVFSQGVNVNNVIHQVIDALILKNYQLPYGKTTIRDQLLLIFPNYTKSTGKSVTIIPKSTGKSVTIITKSTGKSVTIITKSTGKSVNLFHCLLHSEATREPHEPFVSDTMMPDSNHDVK